MDGGSLLISHEKYIKDGKVLDHLDSNLAVIGLTGIGPIRKISVFGLVFAVLAQ
jgi:hypothetical protein